MNEENKKDEINLEELENLIINYTQEIMDHNQYIEILKDKDEKGKEEEITKVYKIK